MKNWSTVHNARAVRCGQVLGDYCEQVAAATKQFYDGVVAAMLSQYAEVNSSRVRCPVAFFCLSSSFADTVAFTRRS